MSGALHCASSLQQAQEWVYRPDGRIAQVATKSSYQNLKHYMRSQNTYNDTYFYGRHLQFIYASRAGTTTRWDRGEESTTEIGLIHNDYESPPDVSHRDLAWFCAENVPGEFLQQEGL